MGPSASWVGAATTSALAGAGGGAATFAAVLPEIGRQGVQDLEMGSVAQGRPIPFHQHQSGIGEAGEVVAQGGSGNADAGLDFPRWGTLLGTLDDPTEDGQPHGIPKGLETFGIQVEQVGHGISDTNFMFIEIARKGKLRKI
jgi:hypothetical protein